MSDESWNKSPNNDTAMARKYAQTSFGIRPEAYGAFLDGRQSLRSELDKATERATQLHAAIRQALDEIGVPEGAPAPWMNTYQILKGALDAGTEAAGGQVTEALIHRQGPAVLTNLDHICRCNNPIPAYATTSCVRCKLAWDFGRGATAAAAARQDYKPTSEVSSQAPGLVEDRSNERRHELESGQPGCSSEVERPRTGIVDGSSPSAPAVSTTAQDSCTECGSFLTDGHWSDCSQSRASKATQVEHLRGCIRYGNGWNCMQRCPVSMASNDVEREKS